MKLLCGIALVALLTKAAATDPVLLCETDLAAYLAGPGSWPDSCTCAANCLSCKNGAECLTVAPNFFLNAAKTAEACAANCMTCTGTTAALCSACQDGFEQASDSKVCVSLGAGVATGTVLGTTVTPLTCLDGFYDSGTAPAVACTACTDGSNCGTCTKATVTDTDNAGGCVTCPAVTATQTTMYVQASDTKKCVAVGAWCGAATVAGTTVTCTACADGYTKQAATSTTFTAATCKADVCEDGDLICDLANVLPAYTGYGNNFACPLPPVAGTGAGAGAGAGTGPDAGDEAAAGTVQASAMLLAAAMTIVAALQ